MPVFNGVLCFCQEEFLLVNHQVGIEIPRFFEGFPRPTRDFLEVKMAYLQAMKKRCMAFMTMEMEKFRVNPLEYWNTFNGFLGRRSLPHPFLRSSARLIHIQFWLIKKERIPISTWVNNENFFSALYASRPNRSGPMQIRF